jgi:hypothetical protein
MLVVSIHCRQPLGMLTGCPGPTLGRGGRWDRQTGGEIQLAHAYRKEEE